MIMINSLGAVFRKGWRVSTEELIYRGEAGSLIFHTQGSDINHLL